MTREGGRNQWMIWQFHSWMMACQYSVNYKVDVLYMFILCHLWLRVYWKSWRIPYSVDKDSRECTVAV